MKHYSFDFEHTRGKFLNVFFAVRSNSTAMFVSLVFIMAFLVILNMLIDVSQVIIILFMLFVPALILINSISIVFLIFKRDGVDFYNDHIVIKVGYIYQKWSYKVKKNISIGAIRKVELIHGRGDMNKFDKALIYIGWKSDCIRLTLFTGSQYCFRVNDNEGFIKELKSKMYGGE